MQPYNTTRSHRSRSQTTSIRQLGGSAALVTMWKRYLWSSEASIDDIAVSWRIFTTLATHDAINRLIHDPELARLLHQNAKAVSTLQRHICARLENASWRVWFEKRTNPSTIQTYLPSKNNDQQQRHWLTKSPESQKSSNSSSGGRFAAVSGFRQLQQSSYSLAKHPAEHISSPSALSGQLNRSRSEPNIIQLPFMHKRQRTKVTKWLSHYIVTSLRSISLITGATTDREIEKRPELRSIKTNSRSLDYTTTGAASDSLSPDSFITPHLQSGNLNSTVVGLKDEKSCITKNSSLIDIQQSGVFSKYRYVVRIPQRSLLTKIIKESSEDVSHSGNITDGPAPEIKSYNNISGSSSSSTEVGNRERLVSTTSLASSTRKSSASLLSQQAYTNINVSSSRSSLDADRLSRDEDITRRPGSSKSIVAENNASTLSLKYRNTETAPIDTSEATVTVIPGNIHRKDQTHQHILHLSGNQAHGGDIASCGGTLHSTDVSRESDNLKSERKKIAENSQKYFDQAPSIW